MENKLRKHRKQMTSAEIEYTETLVHGITDWRSDVCRGHLIRRGRNFTHEQMVNACRTGRVIEVNSLGRILMRDDLGMCVVISVKDRVIFTAYANYPNDNHEGQSMDIYTFRVDVISYRKGAMMDWNDAVSLARTLMNEHGLGHIPFEAHRSKRYFGTTRFIGRRQIFSRQWESWEVKGYTAV